MVVVDKTVSEIVDSIDFSSLTEILHKKRGKFENNVDKYIYLYRCVLKIAAMHPLSPIAPPKCVDDLLHLHILDTRKYEEDCERIFGSFVHHDPYVDGTEEFFESWRFTIDKLEEYFQVSVDRSAVYTRDELEPVGCWLLPRNHISSPRTC